MTVPGLRRPTASRLTGVTATCQACDWTAHELNALPLGARHHDTTGHPVDVVLTRRITYGTTADLDRAREAAGQQNLLGGAT